MPKMICIPCQTELTIAKSGIYIVEYFGEPQRPYKIWSADAWRCPSCGNLVAAGLPDNPLHEHYEEGFDAFLEKIRNSKTAQAGWVVDDYEHRHLSNICKCGAWTTGVNSTELDPEHDSDCPCYSKELPGAQP